ncbi:hypothetical protein AMJ96_CH00605 [Rhizobium sp. N113]|nr:hypothetical protein AMJ96_CH00605 [Rhizobium sp. N113]
MTAEEITEFEASRAVDLPVLKAMLKATIDAAAETERLRYITTGAGQALTYAQKSDEAKAWLAAVDPVDSDFPLLSAEVGITAQSIGEVAAIVYAAYVQWQQIGSLIEAIRLGTKKAISEATTEEAARLAAADVVWPSTNLGQL